MFESIWNKETIRSFSPNFFFNDKLKNCLMWKMAQCTVWGFPRATSENWMGRCCSYSSSSGGWILYTQSVTDPGDSLGGGWLFDLLTQLCVHRFPFTHACSPPPLRCHTGGKQEQRLPSHSHMKTSDMQSAGRFLCLFCFFVAVLVQDCVCCGQN